MTESESEAGEPDAADPAVDPALDPAGLGYPHDPTPARRWAVFLTSVLLTGALIALVLLAIELPHCESPPNSWAPCIGP